MAFYVEPQICHAVQTALDTNKRNVVHEAQPDQPDYHFRLILEVVAWPNLD